MPENGHAPTIGSSSIAAILGLSPWSGPWDVWAKMQGLAKPFQTRATLRGHILEPAIADYYGSQTGCALAPGPAYEEAPIIGPESWMHARPDRFAKKEDDEWLVEIKSTRKFGREWGQPGTSDVPQYYAVQCIWQMAVTGHSRTDLAAFATISDEYRVFTIHRDMQLEKQIVDFARDWYSKYVITCEPPDTDGSIACSRTLAKRFHQKSDAYVEPTPEDRSLAIDIKSIREKINKMEIEKREKENVLKDRIGEHKGMAGVCTWASGKPRVTVNSKALKEEHPDIFVKYSKTGDASRQFRFTYQPEE